MRSATGGLAAITNIMPTATKIEMPRNSQRSTLHHHWVSTLLSVRAKATLAMGKGSLLLINYDMNN